MSKTFRAIQTKEKRRRPQSKKSKRTGTKHLIQEAYVEMEEKYYLRDI